MAISRTRPARLAVGLAVLATERLRADARGRMALLIGLAGQAAEQTTRAGAAVSATPERVGRLLARVPGARPVAAGAARLAAPVRAGPGGLARRAADRAAERVAAARQLGAATMAADRAEALAFLRAGLDSSVAWASRTVVPKAADDLMPYVIEDLMPRLIDGAMPRIRAEVLPLVIDDLCADPRVRQLVLDQSRGALGDAASHLRATAAGADDRIESALRRLLGRPARPAPPAAGAPEAPGLVGG